MTTELLFPDLYLGPPGEAYERMSRKVCGADGIGGVLQRWVEESDRMNRREAALERLRMRGWKIILPVEREFLDPDGIDIPRDVDGEPIPSDHCDESDNDIGQDSYLEDCPTILGFPECPECCAHWCDQCWRDNGGQCLNGCGQPFPEESRSE